MRNRVKDSDLPKSISGLLMSKLGNAEPHGTGKSPSPSGVTALSIEFVAKPQETHKVAGNLPAAINGAFREVTGFAGCCVLISDKEARLVTVMTFWSGDQHEVRCAENVRWIYALLEPYVDRCLRAQTFVAQLPATARINRECLRSPGYSITGNEVAEDDALVVV